MTPRNAWHAEGAGLTDGKFEADDRKAHNWQRVAQRKRDLHGGIAQCYATFVKLFPDMARRP
jgi:hypothetical protein